jgi:hypothetical protein
VLSVLIILLYNDKDTTWASIKKRLGEANFMKKFMVFDPNTITEKQLQRIKAITKKESFNYEH